MSHISLPYCYIEIKNDLRQDILSEIPGCRKTSPQGKPRRVLSSADDGIKSKSAISGDMCPGNDTSRARWADFSGVPRNCVSWERRSSGGNEHPCKHGCERSVACDDEIETHLARILLEKVADATFSTRWIMPARASFFLPCVLVQVSSAFEICQQSSPSPAIAGEGPSLAKFCAKKERSILEVPPYRRCFLWLNRLFSSPFSMIIPISTCPS